MAFRMSWAAVCFGNPFLHRNTPMTERHSGNDMQHLAISNECYLKWIRKPISPLENWKWSVSFLWTNISIKHFEISIITVVIKDTRYIYIYHMHCKSPLHRSILYKYKQWKKCKCTLCNNQVISGLHSGLTFFNNYYFITFILWHTSEKRWLWHTGVWFSCGSGMEADLNVSLDWTEGKGRSLSTMCDWRRPAYIISVIRRSS